MNIKLKISLVFYSFISVLFGIICVFIGFPFWVLYFFCLSDIDIDEICINNEHVILGKSLFITFKFVDDDFLLFSITFIQKKIPCK